MTEVLTVDNLGFRAGGKAILENVSFRVANGEFVCIIGPNGAGKSSLLKNIIKIMQPSEGLIKAAGKDLGRLSQKELAAVVSYVPQYLEKIPPFTVYEFVAMSRFPYKNYNHTLSPQEHSIIIDALADVDLSDFKESLLNILSGGELQRVMIAAALAQETEMLLLDEPFASQDPKHQEEVFKLLLNLKTKKSVAVLCVCHDLNIATRLSDRLIALKEGKIIYEGNSADFISENMMDKLYDTEFITFNKETGSLPFVFTREIAGE